MINLSKCPAALLKQWLAGLFFMLIFAACSTGYSMSDKSEPVYTSPVFEIYPPEDMSPHREIPVSEPLSYLPKVAIIIDDIGYDKAIVKKFLSLDASITFSIFPSSPFQKTIVRQIQKKGMEIMLHLPMEPEEFPAVQPGPGALLAAMSPEAFTNQLQKNLNSIPQIKGVNNHMGSRLTTGLSFMYCILSELKKRNLFFVDSYTSAQSVCRSSAQMLQLPFARRDVFLDHVQTHEFVESQIQRLIQIAQAYGEAVGIGHPHEITYEILKDILPDMQKQVQLVPVSQLVHIIG